MEGKNVHSRGALYTVCTFVYVIIYHFQINNQHCLSTGSPTPTPSSTLPITLPTTLHCRPHDKEQQCETVTLYMGERRYWGWQRTSGEGTPAFLCIFFFFTNYFEGPWRRGGFPLLCCVCFHTDVTRGGKPLLHCVSFHTNVTRGVSPFSVVFLSTQT